VPDKGRAEAGIGGQQGEFLRRANALEGGARGGWLGV